MEFKLKRRFKSVHCFSALGLLISLSLIFRNGFHLKKMITILHWCYAGSRLMINKNQLRIF